MRPTLALERQRPESCLSDLRIDRWLAGELEGAARTAVENHLHSCAACRERADQVAPDWKDSAAAGGTLYLQLRWGETVAEARAFSGDVLANLGASDSAMPLWGFELPADFLLARGEPSGFRLRVPPGARVEGARAGPGAEVLVRGGESIRLVGPSTSLVASVGPAPFREPMPRSRGWAARMPGLWSTVAVLCAASVSAFILALPREAAPELPSRPVSPLAIRLIAGEPRRKVEAQQSLEHIRAREPVRLQGEEHHKAPAAKGPSPRLLGALSRLTSGGAATREMLAQMRRLGVAPHGAHTLRELIGQNPFPGAGQGSYGLGPLDGQTGAEWLHGGHAAGIGAMGAGSVGRGVVGGLVLRANPRAVFAASEGDRELIAQVVNQHLGEVRSCYETALRRDAKLEGKVTLEWQVSGGRARRARVGASSLGDPVLTRCLVEHLETWHFPALSQDPTRVSYPFQFSPSAF